MIVIIDYGMGNLRSVYNACTHLNTPVEISCAPDVIDKAEKIILPGVGAFGDAMKELVERKLIEPIRRGVSAGKPFLGICLGLQLLFERSEESLNIDGLSFLPGTITRFNKKMGNDYFKVPHMGWNTVEIVKSDCPILSGVQSDSFFYFVHSFYAPSSESSHVTGITHYGAEYASIVWHDNIFATQFHPEKSQEVGLRILKNFIDL